MAQIIPQRNEAEPRLSFVFLLREIGGGGHQNLAQTVTTGVDNRVVARETLDGLNTFFYNPRQ